MLLCEDKQHRVFVRRFLLKMGWQDHQIRVRMAGPADGSAEQYVRNRFPKELKDHRSRRGRVSEALMVMVDGDNRGVRTRVAEFDSACKTHGLARRPESVLVFVPTWKIETWLAYLNGETVDESRRDYPRLQRERDCAPHVDVLVDMCRRSGLRQPAPDSLVTACAEWGRWAASG